MCNDPDKAELIQSVKAFLIPSSLFLATVIMAAGTFLLYNGYQLGWLFIAVAVTVMAGAFIAFVKFQNKLRAGGQFAKAAEPEYGPDVSNESQEGMTVDNSVRALDKVS